MEIVLIRHGQKDPEYFPDKDTPLTQEGKVKIDRLKDLLVRLHLSPEIYLTIMCEHAKQTAERLSDTRPNAVYPIDALTPHSRANITRGCTKRPEEPLPIAGLTLTYGATFSVSEGPFERK